MPGRILIVDDDPLVPRTLTPAAAEARPRRARRPRAPSEAFASSQAQPGRRRHHRHQHAGRRRLRGPQARQDRRGRATAGRPGHRLRHDRERRARHARGRVRLRHEARARRGDACSWSSARSSPSRLRARERRAPRGARPRQGRPARSIGQRPRASCKVFDTIEAVAPTRATVLVTGESGTGKSMVARMIHEASPRRGGAVRRDELRRAPRGPARERALRPHEGRVHRRRRAPAPGRFLAADHGTLFLDEIGAATPALQLKLLRVLQERKFEPVGSEETIEVDVRLVLATNEDLGEGASRRAASARTSSTASASCRSTCRRCASASATCPLLAAALPQALRRGERASRSTTIDDSTMTILQSHAWPGNIRELENVIERGVILARGDGAHAGRPAARAHARAPAPDRRPHRCRSKRALEIPEREIIERTLRAHDWNRQATAARPRHQPHDALQQDAQVRPAGRRARCRRRTSRRR